MKVLSIFGKKHSYDAFMLGVGLAIYTMLSGSA
jgi:hypothetical protein